jgi:hypothetical protein
MKMIQPLNLPKAALKLSSRAGRIYVNCLVRRKAVVLTPEEWVRQHLIAYLNFQLGYPLEKISVEKQLNFNGFTKRWDVVVYNKHFEPLILVECKAPEIRLSHDVFMQIAGYQKKVQAKWLILTNGLTHLVYEVDAIAKELIPQLEFPKYDAFNFE